MLVQEKDGAVISPTSARARDEQHSPQERGQMRTSLPSSHPRAAGLPIPIASLVADATYRAFILRLLTWSTTAETTGLVLALLVLNRQSSPQLWISVVWTAIVLLTATWCRTALTGSHPRRALRVYLATHIAYLSWALLIAPPPLSVIPILMLGACLLTATYLETPRTSMRWAAFAILCYLAASIGRFGVPPADLGIVEPFVEAIVPPAVLALFAVQGRKATSMMHDALRASAYDRQAMEHAYAAIEQRVDERTFELEQATAELALAKEMAEQANRLKSEFLASVSHELRTPLNAIINFAYLLSEPRHGTLSPKQARMQERVIVNSEHLLLVINNILDLSRIEAGQVQLLIADVDLDRMLDEAVDTARCLLKGKPIHLAVDLPPEPLPTLRGDATCIRQILLNLLSNAVKFTMEGQITVRVEVMPSTCTIAVSDTGIGIDAADIDRIFENFQQVDGNLARQYAGTGLGLPISKHLVELHGGHMSVVSAVGTGSTFAMSLPRLPQAGVDPDPSSVTLIDHTRLPDVGPQLHQRSSASAAPPPAGPWARPAAHERGI